MNIFADNSALIATLDQIFLFVFLGILVLLVLAFLRGLLHGWRYGTYRLIFMSALVALAIILVGPIADSLRGVDLLSAGLPASFAFEINGNNVSFNVGTVQETLENGVYAVLHDGFGVTASPAELISYVTALAASILRIIVFLLEMIIVWLLGFFLCFLLWHILFKHFTPKEKRKKKKLRLLSGFENLVVVGVCGALFLAPLTGMVNGVKNSLSVDKANAEKNETVQLIDDVLTSYDNSLLSQIFFAKIGMDGTESLDTSLLRFISDVQVDEIQGSVVSELQTLTKLGSSLMNLYFGNSNEQGIAWKSLLTSAEIPAIFASLTETPLIKVALPFAATIATSLDEVKNILGEETIDYLKSTNVDWVSELDNLGKIYGDVAESGIFDFVKDEYSESPTLLFDSAYDILFGTDQFQKSIKKISTSIEQSAVLDRLICGYVYTTVDKNPEQAKDDDPTTIQLIDVLPMKADKTVDYEKMTKIHWFDEVVVLFNSLCTINEANPTAVEELVNKGISAMNPPEGEDASSIFNLNTILGLVAQPESVEGIIKAIVGPRDASGTPIATDGFSADKSCLLDSVLLGNALPEILPMVASSLAASISDFSIDSHCLDSVNTSLCTGTDAQVRVNFKTEFGHMLDVIGKLTSTPEGVAFLSDFEHMPGLDVDPDGNIYGIKAGLIDAVSNSLVCIDQSEVLTALIPDIADGYLDASGALDSYGIVPDFNCENLGNELASLLDIARYSMDPILNLLTMGSNLTPANLGSFLVGNQTELTHLLDIICSSKILNPVIGGKMNTNIVALFNKLFESTGSASFSLKDGDIPTDRALYGTWNGATEVTQGEMHHVVAALSDIASSGILSSLADMGSMSTTQLIETLSKLNFTQTFTDVGSSAVLSKVVARMLDDMFVKQILQVSDYGLEGKVSFTALETPAMWAAEGAAFQQIVDCAVKGVDLSNFDPFGGDGGALIEILTKLAGSRMFYVKQSDGTASYSFPTYLYNRLLSAMDGEQVLNYFSDQGATGPAPTDLAGKQAITTTFKANVDDITTGCTTFEQCAANWTCADGPLDQLGDILVSVGKLGGLDGLSSFDIGSIGTLEGVVQTVNASTLLGEIIIPKVLKTALGSVSGGGIDFSSANTDWFYGKTVAQRSAELNSIFSLIKCFADETYGVYNGTSIDLSSLSLATISTDYFLEPILQSAIESHVLFEKKPGAERSVFQQLIAMVIQTAGLYSVSDANTAIAGSATGAAKNTLTINDIVASIGDDPTVWQSQISDLCDLVDKVKDSDFLVGGTVDFSCLNDPVTYFATDRGRKIADLGEMLSLLDQTELFRRVLPLRLGDVLSGDLLGASSTYSDDIKLADPYCRQINDGTGDVYDWAAYGQSEIDNLVACFGSIADLTGIDASDLTTIDPEAMAEAIVAMAKTDIFNSNTTKATGTKTGLTAVQALMADILGNDAFADFFYSASSPKDAHYTTLGAYNNSTSKAIYLVKTLLGTSSNVTEQQLSYINGETGSIRSVLSYVFSDELAGVFSGGSFDFSALEPSMFAHLMKSFTRCIYFADLVPNAISNILTTPGNGYSVDGVDMNAGSYYYAYWYVDADGNELTSPLASPNFDAVLPDSEIDQIAVIMGAVKQGSSLLNSFAWDSLDSTFVHDLLLDFYNSYVFHLADEVTRTVHYDIFHQVIALVLNKSGAFGTLANNDTAIAPTAVGNAKNTMTINSIIDSLGSTDAVWYDEINGICDILDAIQASSFVDGSGNLDFSPLSDPAAYFATDVDAKKAELSNILNLLDGSELFRRALPMKLAGVLESDVLGSGNPYSEDVKLSDAYCRQTNSGVGDTYDWASYGDTEINKLVDVLARLGSLGSFNASDLTTIDPAALTLAITDMAQTDIFNSNATKGTGVRAGLTSVQALMNDLLGNDGFAPYYYLASSPKDIYHAAQGDYSSFATKTHYMALTNLDVASSVTAEQLDHISGTANSIRSVLTYLLSAEFSSVFAGGTFDFSAITPTTFSHLMKEFNGCVYFADLVPNAMTSILTDSANGYTVDGIDMKRGNYFFAYSYSDENGNLSSTPSSTPNYNAIFPESEIDQIASIMDVVNTNTTILSSFDVNTIDPIVIRSLLEEFKNSYVFHLSGPETRSVVIDSDTDVLTITDNLGAETVINDLSVFEQLMFKIYDASTLASQAFHNAYDLHDYYRYGSSGYLFKLYNNIKGFDESLWLDEIIALTTDGLAHPDGNYVGLISVLQNSGILSALGGGGTIHVDSDSIMLLAPAKIRLLLSALNRCTVTSDSLAYSMQSMVASSGSDGLGIDKYSASTVNLSNATSQIEIPSSFVNADGDFLTISALKFAYAGDADQGFFAKIDLDGDGAFETSLPQSYTPSSVSSGIVGVDVTKIHERFILCPKDGGSGFTSVVAAVNTSNFLVSPAVYEATGINSLIDFLSSTYRGKSTDASNTDTAIYYSFSNVSSSLRDFIDDPYSVYTHSTYGVLSIFTDSGFFNWDFNDDGTFATGTASYSARDLAIYKLLGVELDFGGTPFKMSLGSRIGTALTSDELGHYKAIHEEMGASATTWDVHEEAAYLDQFIMSAGYLDAYLESINSMTNAATLPLFNYIIATQASGVLDYLASSSFAPYSIETYESYSETEPNTPVYSASFIAPGMIGSELLDSHAELLYTGWKNGATLDHPAVPTISNSSSYNRSSGIPASALVAPDFAGMDELSRQGYLEAAAKAFSAYFAIADGFNPLDSGTYAKLTDAAKIAAAANAFEELGYISSDSKGDLVALAYFSNLYDVLVARTYFTLTGMDMMSMQPKYTDFPTMNANCYLDSATANIAFSYSQVASVISA